MPCTFTCELAAAKRVPHLVTGPARSYSRNPCVHGVDNSSPASACSILCRSRRPLIRPFVRVESGELRATISRLSSAWPSSSLTAGAAALALMCQLTHHHAGSSSPLARSGSLHEDDERRSTPRCRPSVCSAMRPGRGPSPPLPSLSESTGELVLHLRAPRVIIPRSRAPSDGRWSTHVPRMGARGRPFARIWRVRAEQLWRSATRRSRVGQCAQRRHVAPST